jgi:DNA-binding beta-propeller fold protein YncE
MGLACLLLFAECQTASGPSLTASSLRSSSSAARAPAPHVNSSVIAQIPANFEPTPAALDTTNGDLLIATDYSVEAIDGANNTVIAVVPVNGTAWAVTFAPSSGDFYVPENPPRSVDGLPGLENLSVISGTNDDLVATIPLPAASSGVGSPATFDPSNGDLYVAMSGEPGHVNVISSATDRVTATLLVGSEPSPPIYDPSNGDVYVPEEGNNVTVIAGATNTVAATIHLPAPAGTGPGPAVLDSANQALYVPVGGYGSSEVFVVSTANDTVVATWPFHNPVFSVAVDSATGNVFVVNGNGTVSMFNDSSNALVSTLADPGVFSLSPAFDPMNGAFYYPNFRLGGFSVIAGSNDTLVANVTLDNPAAVDLGTPTFDPRNGQVYMPAGEVGAGTGYLYVIGNASAPTPPSTSFPWLLVGIGAAAAVAVVAVTLTFLRRRPPSSAAPDPTGR